MIYFYVSKALLKKIKNFLFSSLLQINIFLVFLDYFDAMISKIIYFCVLKVLLKKFKNLLFFSLL
jgi:hypothetical protein